MFSETQKSFDFVLFRFVSLCEVIITSLSGTNQPKKTEQFRRERKGKKPKNREKLTQNGIPRKKQIISCWFLAEFWIYVLKSLLFSRNDRFFVCIMKKFTSKKSTLFRPEMFWQQKIWQIYFISMSFCAILFREFPCRHAEIWRKQSVEKQKKSGQTLSCSRLQ